MVSKAERSKFAEPEPQKTAPSASKTNSVQKTDEQELAEQQGRSL